MPYISCYSLLFCGKVGGNTPHYEEVCRFLNKKSPNLNHLRLGESVEKIIKYEQYQLNRGLNVEFDFIQPSLNTEAGTGLVDVREITMT